LKTRKEIWLQTEMYKVILNYDWSKKKGGA
jgi:hypothetical protein